ELTFLLSVRKIERYTYSQPDQQTPPAFFFKGRNQVTTHQHTGNRHKRHQWSSERPWSIRHFFPHHQHPDTHQHKGKQGTNTYHVTQVFYGDKSGKNTDEKHKEDVGFPRRTELGMNITKHFRQQSITAHG